MSNYPGYNPGQFQQPGNNFGPPPPGSGAGAGGPPPPMQHQQQQPPGAGAGQGGPNQFAAPTATPGHGFAPPGSQQPMGMPGGMQNMNSAMGGMNINHNHQSQFNGGPPPPGQPMGQPMMGQQQPMGGSMGPPPPGQGAPLNHPQQSKTFMQPGQGHGAPAMMMQPPGAGAGAGAPMGQQQPGMMMQPGPGMMMQQPGPPAPGTFGAVQPGMMQPGPPGQGQPGMGMGGAPAHNAPGGAIDVDYKNVIPGAIFRPTTTMIPSTASMASSFKVPCGGILRPFANPGEGEGDIDVVHPSAAGIVRCKRCRTYINAFVSWLENGRRWRCNICSQLNETASAYFCHLDDRNQRRDKEQRPELSKSVVEWVAPSEYMVRAPQAPAFFFVFDVSVNAVRSGMLHTAAKAIKNSLDTLPGMGNGNGDARTMVGFITFDTAVHYYSLKPGSSNPQMMVVGDLDELFVPAPNDLLVYLKDSREAVDNLLDNLPTMFNATTANSSCLGPALKAAFTVMKAVGGKMCLFQSSMPTLGDGAIRARGSERQMGTPNEVKLLRPQSQWYKDTAVEFSRAQISVDMFLFPSEYIDVATLSELSKITAGSTYTYVGYNPAVHGNQFGSQLHRRLTQDTAFESVLRVRCTKGMRISNFYGNFFVRGTDLLALPNCSADSVFGFDLVHEDQSINVPYVTLQSALLYTTSEGERRIRVATQVLRTTTRNTEFMASIDSQACIALLSKQAMSVGLKTNLDNARNRLQQSCVDMIAASKGGDTRTVSGYTMPAPSPNAGGAPGANGAGGESKEMPENLKSLPLYTLALLKNVAFRGGTDVHPDERYAAYMALSTMMVTDTLNFVHPRLFSIHDMEPHVGMPSSLEGDDDDDDGAIAGENSTATATATATAGRNKIVLPPAINLSVERLNSEGVFLLDNGKDAIVWVGRAANPAVLSALLGVESLEGVDMSQVRLVTSGNDLASRLDCMIQALHEENDPTVPAVAPKVQIIREGDGGMEARFFWNFIEDRAQFNGGTFSYDEFMAFVNRPPGAAGGAPPGGMPPGAPMGGMPPGRGPMDPPGGVPGMGNGNGMGGMAPPGGMPPGPGRPMQQQGPPPPMPHGHGHGGGMNMNNNNPTPHHMNAAPPSAPMMRNGPMPPNNGGGVGVGIGGPPPPNMGGMPMQMQMPAAPSTAPVPGRPTPMSMSNQAPPMSGGYGGPPPPSSGGYGAGPPGPPSSLQMQMQPPGPPGSGQYGRPVAAGPPPNSGGYGGPAAPGPPPNGHGNPPPPQQYGMPPPPR